MKMFVVYDDFDDRFIGDKRVYVDLIVPKCFTSIISAEKYIKEEYMKNNGKVKYSGYETRTGNKTITWIDKDHEYHTFYIIETEAV